MKLNISENKIHRIVSETLNRFIIKETFTNMKQLYHRTPIDSLFSIIKSNSFFLMPSNHTGRGGKYYASLSRHKNDVEGFDAISYAEEKENGIQSYATITFNIPKLTRVHGISIEPFDFYGTHSDDRNHHEYIPVHKGHGHGDSFNVEGVDDYDNGVYSKVIYQKLKKGYDNWTDEEDDEMGFYNYDAPEYYNMAEENIVSDTIKEIPEIFNYIDRIDVYFPSDLEETYKDFNPYTGEEEEDDYAYGYDETFDFANALCFAVCGTEWERKLVVNLTKNNKIQKTISIREFSEWLKSEEKYKTHSAAGNSLNNREPKKREQFNGYFDDDYEDDYDYPVSGHH